MSAMKYLLCIGSKEEVQGTKFLISCPSCSRYYMQCHCIKFSSNQVFNAEAEDILNIGHCTCTCQYN